MKTSWEAESRKSGSREQKPGSREEERQGCAPGLTQSSGRGWARVLEASVKKRLK